MKFSLITKVNDIFTPTTIAKKNYIYRRKFISEFNKHLTTQGKQIIVYGHSGSGKTTLVMNELHKCKQKYIKTQCSHNTTYDQLILQVFDELDLFYKTKQMFTLGTSLSGQYNELKAGITSEVSTTESRMVPVQLTPQKLARFLGEKKAVWIIEDFHKISIEEKTKIADALKIFIDESNDYPAVKIICIGAVGSSSQLLELDDNLVNRVSDLHIPLLSDSEITSIVRNGFKMLNVQISDDLVNSIIIYSNNIGSVAHQLCLEICLLNNIKKRKFGSTVLSDTSLVNAIKSIAENNAYKFKKQYDEIKANSKYGTILLKQFHFIGLRGVHYDNIVKRVSRSIRNFNNVEFETYINDLTIGKFKDVLRYNSDSKHYSVASPFFLAYVKMQIGIERSERPKYVKPQKSQNRQVADIASMNLEINKMLSERYLEIMLKTISDYEKIKK